MPGLPQNTFDASNESRVSSNTSVLVSLVLKAPRAPKQPSARRFAFEMPVPFGPVMLRMLTQVSGKDEGMKVSGSEMKVNTFQVHSKSRLPPNGPPTSHAPAKPT